MLLHKDCSFSGWGEKHSLHLNRLRGQHFASKVPTVSAKPSSVESRPTLHAKWELKLQDLSFSSPPSTVYYYQLHGLVHEMIHKYLLLIPALYLSSLIETAQRKRIPVFVWFTKFMVLCEIQHSSYSFLFFNVPRDDQWLPTPSSLTFINLSLECSVAEYYNDEGASDSLEIYHKDII